MAGAVENVTGSTVDAIQFGIMIGKMDTIIDRFDRLESNIESTYATKESVTDLKKRVDKLENAPRVRRAEIIAIFACVFTGIGGIGTIVAAHWK